MAILVATSLAESRQQSVRQPESAQSAADAAVLQRFDAAVRQYMLLRRNVVAELPPLVVTPDPAVIASRSDAIAYAILRARGQVSTGAFFSPSVAAVLRRRIAAIANSADFADIFAPSGDEASTLKGVDVHARFPVDSPLATMPASFLNVLPPLPLELEYRFIGTTLVIRDVQAALILDLATDMADRKP